MNSFTIKNIFDDAWKDYQKYWKVILLSFTTFGIVHLVSMVGSYFDYSGTLVQDGFASLLSGLGVVWLGIGYINFLLNIVDGKQARYRDIFYGVRSPEQFAYYLLVTLAYTVLVVLGLVLLIIPGVILSIGFLFVRYYIAENRLGFMNAFQSSWEITKGNRWKIFWFGIVLFFFNLVGLLALGFGLLVTIPMSQLMWARMFRQLEGIPLPEGGSDTEESEMELEV
jgi:uncharacterized membrane protein